MIAAFTFERQLGAAEKAFLLSTRGGVGRSVDATLAPIPLQCRVC